MRRWLPCLLAYLWLVPAQGWASPDPLRSIRILHWHHGDLPPHPACTTWATQYRAQRAWVTAAHCVAPDERFSIGGVRVFVVRVDTDVDIAILRGGPSAPPLFVAFGVPDLRRAVWAAGFPFGHREPHVVGGLFSGVDRDGRGLWGLPSAPGMSGAPILDAKDGAVVGMIAQNECELPLWCAFSLGPPVSALWRILFGG
mgnify:FL=1